MSISCTGRRTLIIIPYLILRSKQYTHYTVIPSTCNCNDSRPNHMCLSLCDLTGNNFKWNILWLNPVIFSQLPQITLILQAVWKLQATPSTRSLMVNRFFEEISFDKCLIHAALHLVLDGTATKHTRFHVMEHVLYGVKSTAILRQVLLQYDWHTSTLCIAMLCLYT